MANWTDPNQGQGGFKKDFELRAGNYPTVLSRKTGQEQMLEALKGASETVSKIMAQRQKDTMYNVLLQHAGQQYQDLVSQGLTPEQAYKEYQSDVDAGEESHKQSLADQITQMKLSAMRQKLGWEPGGMNPYEQDTISGGMGSQKVQVTLPDGSKVWVTGNKAAEMQASGGAQMAPTTRNLLLKRQQALQDAAYTERQANPSGNFTRQDELDALNNQLAGAPQSSEVPTYTPQTVDTSPDAQSNAKTLDAKTAQLFLQQAGGDKDKARALAQAAGYTF